MHDTGEVGVGELDAASVAMLRDWHAGECIALALSFLQLSTSPSFFM
jgi:hypothetical protein